MNDCDDGDDDDAIYVEVSPVMYSSQPEDGDYESVTYETFLRSYMPPVAIGEHVAINRAAVYLIERSPIHPINILRFTEMIISEYIPVVELLKQLVTSWKYAYSTPSLRTSRIRDCFDIDPSVSVKIRAAHAMPLKRFFKTLYWLSVPTTAEPCDVGHANESIKTVRGYTVQQFDPFCCFFETLRCRSCLKCNLITGFAMFIYFYNGLASTYLNSNDHLNQPYSPAFGYVIDRMCYEETASPSECETLDSYPIDLTCYEEMPSPSDDDEVQYDLCYRS